MTTKTTTILAIVIIAGLMSGCIESETRIPHIEINVITDPEIQKPVKPVNEPKSIPIIKETPIVIPTAIVRATVTHTLPPPRPDLTPVPTSAFIEPTVTPTSAFIEPKPIPTIVKNAEPTRPASAQIGFFIGDRGTGYDKVDYIPMIIYCDRYLDVEQQARCEVAVGGKCRCNTELRVDPDIKSYDIYVNGELRESYTLNIEDFSKMGTTDFRPTITEEDYPVTVKLVVEYIDGEGFTIGERSQDTYPDYY